MQIFNFILKSMLENS